MNFKGDPTKNKNKTHRVPSKYSTRLIGSGVDFKVKPHPKKKEKSTGTLKSILDHYLSLQTLNKGPKDQKVWYAYRIYRHIPHAGV